MSRSGRASASSPSRSRRVGRNASSASSGDDEVSGRGSDRSVARGRGPGIRAAEQAGCDRGTARVRRPARAVDPSSETMISSAGRVCARIDDSASPTSSRGVEHRDDHAERHRPSLGEHVGRGRGLDHPASAPATVANRTCRVEQSIDDILEHRARSLVGRAAVADQMEHDRRPAASSGADRGDQLGCCCRSEPMSRAWPFFSSVSSSDQGMGRRRGASTGRHPGGAAPRYLRPLPRVVPGRMTSRVARSSMSCSR